MELWVKGYRCTDGFSKLDIIPRRCMFINTDGVARIVLKFPELVPAPVIVSIPPHALGMFNVLPREQRICSICTEEMSVDVCQTKCFHHFHVACLRKTVDRVCPNCRGAL